MKRKKFTDPLINPMTEVLGDNSGGPGSNHGGDDSNAIRPLPMSFDEWTMSRFCGDVDGSGGVDFADYASWWSTNGFSEEGLLAYNPELAAVEEAVELEPDLGTEVLGEDIFG